MTEDTALRSPAAAPPDADASAPARSWLLSEPLAGLEAQGLGLAEAAGLAPERRHLHRRGYARWLTPALWPAPLRAVDPAALAPPLPELLLGCGGAAAPILARLRRRGVRTVQIQDPRIDPARFDLVIANRHDRIAGPNVITIRTALHRATPGRRAAAAAAWSARLASLPRPLVAVLVGGSNGRFRLDAPAAASLAADLVRLIVREGAGVALTPSRRTDPAALALLRDALAPHAAAGRAWVWDGEGENPYFGLLGLADVLIPTVDSVSMISEAVATSAPVLVAPLPGRSRKSDLFLGDLLALGRVRRFAGRLETWVAAPLDDTAEAAAEMRRRLGF